MGGGRALWHRYRSIIVLFSGGGGGGAPNLDAGYMFKFCFVLFFLEGGGGGGERGAGRRLFGFYLRKITLVCFFVFRGLTASASELKMGLCLCGTFPDCGCSQCRLYTVYRQLLFKFGDVNVCDGEKMSFLPFVLGMHENKNIQLKTFRPVNSCDDHWVWTMTSNFVKEKEQTQLGFTIYHGYAALTLPAEQSRAPTWRHGYVKMLLSNVNCIGKEVHNLLTYLAHWETYLCPSLPVEHRPSTTPRHCTLFWAALAIPD